MPGQYGIRKLSIRIVKYTSITMIFLALILMGMYWYLPDPSTLKYENPKATAYTKLKCTTDCPLQWTALTDISFFVKQAVVQAEDVTFYSHHGLSLSALEQALWKNITEGRFVWGGSTITMQLARNLYLYPDKTILRKLEEMLLALKIERELSKNRILEIYLNVAEWQPDIFGITSASQHFFKKAPSELEPLEASFLASILPSPKLAGNPEVRQKFRFKGALIFNRLFQQQFPKGLPGDSRARCDERLHPLEMPVVDNILTILFAQKGLQIINGDAVLLSSDQVSALLDDRQNIFVNRLISKMSEGVRPLNCQLEKSMTEVQMISLKTSEEGSPVWVPSSAYANLKALIERATKDGIILQIKSAYRGTGYQIYQVLKDLRMRSYCLSETENLLEAPGYSEHGCLDKTAFDFSSTADDEIPFDETDAYQWLSQHGLAFGFSPGFADQATSKKPYKPWHWRYSATQDVN